MKVGLIDVDGHNFPNLPLMKLAAWHKENGDTVEWYDMFSGHMDVVYMAKVFSFSPDYPYAIDADRIVQGGSGYCIHPMNGKEVYDGDIDNPLPSAIEHRYPDYSIYPRLTKDTAYGFLTRGCPRGCKFCHVASKEGKKSRKVADLKEFWQGQKNIVLCDPNLLACGEWEYLLAQLAESNAWVDFNQGLDIRLVTVEKLQILKRIKVKRIHFAWDRYEDKDEIIPKLKLVKNVLEWGRSKLSAYVLVNFDTTIEQDLERINTLRALDYQPFVMVYNKGGATSEYKALQRWTNVPWLFQAFPTFKDYQRGSY